MSEIPKISQEQTNTPITPTIASEAHSVYSRREFFGIVTAILFGVIKPEPNPPSLIYWQQTLLNNTEITNAGTDTSINLSTVAKQWVRQRLQKAIILIAYAYPNKNPNISRLVIVARKTLPSNAYADTRCSIDTSTRSMLCVIRLNQVIFPPEVLPSIPSFGTYSEQNEHSATRVIAHELAHTLGLSHNASSSSSTKHSDRFSFEQSLAKSGYLDPSSLSWPVKSINYHPFESTLSNQSVTNQSPVNSNR